MGWRDLQRDAAQLFQRLGCEAQIEAKVAGVRAEHEVDVWVRFTMFGQEIRWAVECKCWNTNVPKEKVLAFRSLVDDVGADRGVLISAKGFQAGAIRAAQSTNILLTNLLELRETARDHLLASRLDQIETKTVTLMNRLYDLFLVERTGPDSISSRPRDGVDGNAIRRTVGDLAMLRITLDEIRVGRQPPFSVWTHDESVVAADWEEFAAQAVQKIHRAEAIYEEQIQRTTR